MPIELSGSVLTNDQGSANVAFRSGLGQDDKLRACGDLKHNHVNLHFSDWAPIKLPTWGHIAQMRMGVKADLREWSFSKADREASYKQLPMEPDHRNIAIVAIRNPDTGERVAFPPKALLFGAVAEVIHYNFSPRILSVLFNRIFGAPLTG